MAQFTIENEWTKVVIDEHASEIHHFYHKKWEKEYMWNGDPKYWSGRNPTLFPIVGKTWDGDLHIHGKTYQTGNHGFLRHADFTCIQHDDTHIVMHHEANQDTLSQYPFLYAIDICYTLQKETLTIAYQITNHDQKEMPFGFGLHPAFLCPFMEDPAYHIVFDQPEKIGKTLKLDAQELEKTIIIKDPQSSCCDLTDGTHGVQVCYAGFPWLAFWSPKAPFICIEPWYSHTDFEKVELPFEQREGTIIVKPNETFLTQYQIRIY